MSEAINSKDRKVLAEMISYLKSNKITWDDYDDYFSSLDTKDDSVLSIAGFIWEMTDPEFLENNLFLNYEDLTKEIIKYLESDNPSINPPSERVSHIIIKY